MTESQRAGFVLPIVVTLAFLVGLYVGAYYWLVEAVSFPTWGNAPSIDAYYGKRFGESWPTQTWNNGFASFFRPVHWIDRRVRPQTWEPNP